MRLLVRNLSPKEYQRLSILIFLVDWFIGTASLIGGLNGLGEGEPICTFVVACGIWWWAYRLGRAKDDIGNTGGFLVIGLWILNLSGALLVDFHHYITDKFFWGSSSIVLILVVVAALSGTSSDRHKRSAID
jgi:hypothetical protein